MNTNACECGYNCSHCPECKMPECECECFGGLIDDDEDFNDAQIDIDMDMDEDDMDDEQ
ncbi:MAG: hypothetical protein Q8P68_01915 [Candidatus Peregrinibacteria bacterium]|nr:hypothetical protein [Candidatus Peregrinibacteria bacterium]MDZ4244516.1 hypothetical protein [Candidatus Gracilibacteria bacterium]